MRFPNGLKDIGPALFQIALTRSQIPLDKVRLNQIGLIPQAQALGIQMMLPLFTTSGSVDDELKMLLEVTKSGQILTNGQRIR